MGDNWNISEIYTWLKTNRPNKFEFSEIYANGARFSEAFPETVFEPSPYFLYNNPSNEVQRHWLGFRHSSMGNLTEKLGHLYTNGNPIPLYETAAYFNAALSNQTLFRNHTNWYDRFRNNDQTAYFQALENDGCNNATIDAPDSDLEIEYYYPRRHGGFYDRNGTVVAMNAFVGNNYLQLNCTKRFRVPTTPGLYTASREVTEPNGTTHYCTCQGKLLLSLEKGSSGVVVSPSQVSVNIPSGQRAEYIPTGTGFITNPEGAVAMRRTWNVSPTTQPNNGDVTVVSYFTDADYNAVNSILTTNNQTPLTSPSQMWFYKSSAAAHATVANTPSATILRNGNAASPNLSSRASW